jgi:hypothetical protein
MTDIRIVCTHDALKVAEALTRLLEAEQHRVRMTYGRQALAALEEARTDKEAVLLIWSQDARSQTYMLEWARHTDPVRLCEIARTGDWPAIRRKAQVVDFTTWRGERGGRAWNALNERLRTVGDILNPPKGPPREALMAMAFGAAAAVVGAVVVRMNTIDDLTAPAAAAHDEIASLDPTTGVGGPIMAIEPASSEHEILRFRAVGRNIQPIDWEPAFELEPLPDISTPELRDQTILERVSEFIPAPLRGDREPQTN